MDKKEARFVYADNAATTPVSKEVFETMKPYFETVWGNPSSIYSKGREAGEALARARESIAAHIGASAKELFFTSCGTEADNWAIKGAVSGTGKRHIITSAIEHPAVLNTCRALEKQGCTVTYAGVDEYGKVKVDEIREALCSDTAIVAVMTANNEIGTIQPIREIADLAHAAGALMFTDAVQAMGTLPINVDELGVDMLSMSGHKLHAPKGIGALYVRRSAKIGRFIDGGGQESGKRGGTENVPYIAGFAKALEIATREREEGNARLIAMRDRLIDGLMKIPHTRLNGHPTDRLPGNVNIGFKYIEGESMLLLLDMEGICVSTGSACSSASLEPSHVLIATGVPHEEAHGSLRISLSYDNTEDDVDYILEKVPPIVARLRAMSPIYPGD